MTESIKGTANCIIRNGSLLLIKRTDENGKEDLKVIELSIDQMILLKKNPALLNNPHSLLFCLEKPLDEIYLVADSERPKLLNDKPQSLLVFCYGSNMSSKRLKSKDRCPNAKFVCVATLPSYKFKFNKKSNLELVLAKEILFHQMIQVMSYME